MSVCLRPRDVKPLFRPVSQPSSSDGGLVAGLFAFPPQPWSSRHVRSSYLLHTWPRPSFRPDRRPIRSLAVRRKDRTPEASSPMNRLRSALPSVTEANEARGTGSVAASGSRLLRWPSCSVPSRVTRGSTVTTNQPLRPGPRRWRPQYDLPTATRWRVLMPCWRGRRARDLAWSHSSIRKNREKVLDLRCLKGNPLRSGGNG